MPYLPLGPVDHQHPRILTPLCGTACDQVGRQVVVIVGEKLGHRGGL